MPTYGSMFGYKPVKYTRGRSRTRRPVGGNPRPMSNPPGGPKDPTNKKAPIRTGARVRSGRSITRTRTETKQKYGVSRSIGNNSSLSSNTIRSGLKIPKSVYDYQKMAAPRSFYINTTGNVSCGQGRQQVFVFEYLPLADLQTIKSNLSTTANNVRILLKNGKHVLRLRNQTNTNCRLAIYDMVTKKDGQQTAYDSPVEAWTKSSLDYGDTNQLFYIGQTPYKSMELKKFFGINKVTYISMEPGQQHEHKVYHQYDRVVDTTKYDNAVGTSIAGLTRFSMIIFYGHLAHESTNPSNVTTAPITLDYMYERQFAYKALNTVVNQFTTTNVLPTNIVDLDQMGEDQDKDQNIDVA